MKIEDIEAIFMRLLLDTGWSPFDTGVYICVHLVAILYFEVDNFFQKLV